LRISTVEKLAEALGVNVKELIENENAVSDFYKTSDVGEFSLLFGDRQVKMTAGLDTTPGRHFAPRVTPCPKNVLQTQRN
jgi:hypothetical protein